MMVELLAILGFLLLILALIYNGLVAKRNLCDSALAGIEIQLKKRADLVPNLVETVRGYATHEKTALEAVTRARTLALRESETHPDAALEAHVTLGVTLGHLIGLSENYPDLKADDHFRFLMRSLNEIEAQLSASRRTYNASVNRLNNAVQQFPSNLVASSFGFRTRSYFQLTDEAERVP